MEMVVSRLVSSRGLTEVIFVLCTCEFSIATEPFVQEEIRRRMGAQTTAEHRRSVATKIITNSGTAEGMLDIVRDYGRCA
jgi:hypothetical protein